MYKFDVAILDSSNSIKVPIFIEHGFIDVPVLLKLCGIHGNEINGMEIVRRIIRKKIYKPKIINYN